MKTKETRMRPEDIDGNSGQIEGLPANPRFIRDKRFESLKKSIEDCPEMMKVRPIVVVQHGERFVAICGNMRLNAYKELGFPEVNVIVIEGVTPAKMLREIVIKDNQSFGCDDYDLLANEWDKSELDAWGMEFGLDGSEDGETEEDGQEAKPSGNRKIISIDLESIEQMDAAVKWLDENDYTYRIRSKRKDK